MEKDLANSKHKKARVTILNIINSRHQGEEYCQREKDTCHNDKRVNSSTSTHKCEQS